MNEIKISVPYPPKTIGWWLIQLEEPYRTQALTNWKEKPIYDKNEKVSCIADAIDRGFTWESTPEGHEYWEEFFYNTKLPIDEIKINKPLTQSNVEVEGWNEVDWNKMEVITKDGKFENYYIENEDSPLGKHDDLYFYYYNEDRTKRIKFYVSWNPRLESWVINYTSNVELLNQQNEIKVNKPFAPPKEFPIEINLNNSISIFKYLHDLGYRWTSGRSLIDDYYRDHIFRGGDKTFYIYPASNNSKQLYRGEDIVATKPKIPIEKLSEIKVNPPFSPLIIGKKYIIKNPKNIGNTGKIATFEEENDDRLKFRFDRFNLINLSKKNNRDWIKPYKEETNEIFSKEWWKETLDLDEIKVTIPINFPLEIKSDQDWLRYKTLFIKNGYNWCNGVEIELDDAIPFHEWEYPVILISDIDKNICVGNRNINEIKVVNPNVPTRFPLKVNKNSWSYVANYLDKKGYTWINGKKLINWDPFIHGKLEQFGINPNKDDIYLAVYDDGSISWGEDIKTAVKSMHPYLEIPIKDYSTINESSPINFEDDDYQTYITQNRDKIEKAAAFFNLPILDMEDIFLSGKEVILSDDIWKNLENSKSYRIKTLDDAIKNSLKAGIDPKPYIESIKKGEDLPLPLVLCYGIDKYYLVGGEVILSLYRALGSIPTILQGNLNVGRKEEVIEEDTTNKKEQTQKLIKKFIQFVVKEIGLKKLPSKIKISYNTGRAKEDHSFGAFDPNNNEIWLYVKDRAPADFLRTLAHELVHRKQAEDGRIYFDSGSTGSEIENEANAQAGILMRTFGEQNPEIFDGELLSEIKVNIPYKPKTIGWWLSRLDEPFRSQAFENWKKDFQYEENKNIIYNDFLYALGGAFYWDQTPEGYDYWDGIHEKYKTLNEIKVNKPFTPPKEFPIKVDKNNWKDIANYLDSLGYNLTISPRNKIIDYDIIDRLETDNVDYLYLNNNSKFDSHPKRIYFSSQYAYDLERYRREKSPVTFELDEIKVNKPNTLTFPLYIKNEEEFNKLKPLLIKAGFEKNPFDFHPHAKQKGITIYPYNNTEEDEEDNNKLLIWNSGNIIANLQEGIYGDYLFGDKETGVKIKWYDEEKEEDTPAEKELFTRLKSYADSEFETYSNMNIDDLKPLFDKLKDEYPDIVNPQLTPDTYIYRGTTTTIDKLEELKQLPNTSEDKRNIIIPNQEYSSQRQLSSWSTNYFNAASFAISTAERKDMVPLIVRAKAGDADIYFNPDFMNKLSSQPEEEVLNSTNPINVDILIIKGFDTELYDDENLDEIKVNQPITKPVIGKIYDILIWYNPERVDNDLYEPEEGTKKGKEGWYWSKGWKWNTDNTNGKLKWIDIYDSLNTREYDVSEKIRLNKDNLSEIKINPISIKFPIILNSVEEFDKIKPLFIRGGYKWCNSQIIIIDDLKNESFPRKFYIRPGTDKNICSDYLGRVNEEKTFSKDWWKEVLDLDEIKINKPVIPLKAYKNPSGAIYLLFNGKNKNSTLKSYINYVGWSNKNNSIIYFGLEPHIKKDFTNKLKQKGISYVYDEDGLGLGIDIKYFDIKPTSKYSLYDEDINGWYNKISEDLDEIKVTVPINFPITVSSAEEFKLITDKLYKNGYRYIWKALNGEGEFKPDPFTDWISPAKEIVIDYINIENHPELSQESWEVLKNAKLLDYKQIKIKLWQNQN